MYNALDECAIFCNGCNGVFRLKYLSSPSLLQAWQPIWAEFGTAPEVESVATLLGGGKDVKKTKKDGAFLKQGKLSHIVKALKALEMKRNIGVYAQTSKMVEDCLALQGALYKAGEEDPNKAFLLMSDTSLGEDAENSPLLNCVKNHNSEHKLESLGDIFAQDIFSGLFSVKQELDGIFESASLVFELITTNAFYNPKSASWAWQSIITSVEQEIIRRRKTKTSIEDLTRMMGDVKMKE